MKIIAFYFDTPAVDKVCQQHLRCDAGISYCVKCLHPKIICPFKKAHVMHLCNITAKEFGYKLKFVSKGYKPIDLNLSDIFEDFPRKYGTYSLEETLKRFFEEYKIEDEKED